MLLDSDNHEPDVSSVLMSGMRGDICPYAPSVLHESASDILENEDYLLASGLADSQLNYSTNPYLCSFNKPIVHVTCVCTFSAHCLTLRLKFLI